MIMSSLKLRQIRLEPGVLLHVFSSLNCLYIKYGGVNEQRQSGYS